MAKKLIYSAKPLIILAGLLLASLILPGIKSFLRLSFFEFQAPVWSSASKVQDLAHYWGVRSHSKHELIEANRDLARLNSSYELVVQENVALRDEVARLENLLALPSHTEHRYEVARVIRRDMSGWWQQVTIRKGRMHGIPPGAAVVYSGGVVGRIKELHAYTSVVELVTSGTFRMAAHFEGDARPVTYRGGINLPFHPPMGEVSDVQPDLVVSRESPSRLVSSRLGGVFPDGLTIGYVDRLTRNTDGLFQRGNVKLNRDLLSIEEVAVLIPISTEAPE